jgi:hypothetical protein
MDQQGELSTKVGSSGTQSDVQSFLDRFARAFTSGDGRATAKMWEVPALVVSDGGLHAVGSAAEVEQFFSGGKEQYTSRGISDTRAEIVRLTWATDRLAIVQVRWPYLDERGEEVGEESSTYTLRRGDDGQLRICVAVLHGESPKH